MHYSRAEDKLDQLLGPPRMLLYLNKLGRLRREEQAKARMVEVSFP